MAINQVQLPGSSTPIDVNDKRISGIDTTATSGSSNVITSGAVYTALDGKLGKLAAGTGISISNSTISVDTNTIQPKLTAGTNITIDNNVISAAGGMSYVPGGVSTEWLSKSLPANGQWRNIVKFNGNYYAIINDGSAVYKSADCVNWALESQISGTTMRSLAASNTALVIGTYGDGGYYSTDGTTWTLISGPSLYGVAYGGGRFIGCTGSSTAYQSTDGITWTELFTLSYATNYVLRASDRFLFCNDGSDAVLDSAPTARVSSIWVSLPSYFAENGSGTQVKINCSSGSISPWKFTNFGDGDSPTSFNYGTATTPRIRWNGTKFLIQYSYSGSTYTKSSADGLTWANDAEGYNNFQFYELVNTGSTIVCFPYEGATIYYLASNPGKIKQDNVEITEDVANTLVPYLPYRTAEAQDVIDAGKQDKLTAVNGITINNNNIGTTYTSASIGSGLTVSSSALTVDTNTIQAKLTAGTNITIENNVISATSAEPDAYLKSATTSGNTLTLTKKDDSTVVYTPDLSSKQDVINDLETIRSGAALGATAVQPAAISDMATKTYVTTTLANYSTTTLMNTAISSHHDSTKQDVLTAGANISISGSTISATDTKYTAGTGIAISDTNVISCTASSGVTSITAGTGLTGGTITSTGTIAHATGAGYNHIPSGGSSGQVLKYSAAGTAAWGTDNDTKNTAGSTDTSSKIFLIGATSQAANPQTYSHDTAYVGTDGCLYSGSAKVLTAHQTVTLASGTNNGTLKITTAAGTTDNVAVTGLGSAAYTASTAYADSSHTHNYAGSSSAGGAATSANKVNTAVTFNNGGAGAASGTTFNGSAAVTVSYNTVGAAASGHSHSAATSSSYGMVIVASNNAALGNVANLSYTTVSSW